MIESSLKLLVADKDEVDRMTVSQALKEIAVQAEIIAATTCAETIARMKAFSFDCAFLDAHLPGENGVILVKLLRAANIQTPLIVLARQGDEQTAVELIKAGATDYLSKSNISPERLGITLINALRIHQAEQQIQIQNIQLQEGIAEREQMVLQQKDFISYLTHDLRTPLFASDTMLKMFQKEVFCPLSPEMHQAITAMLRSNYNLIQIVDALLEVHRYEAGVKKLTLMPCDLWEIGNEVIQELLPLAEAKGIALKIGWDGNAERAGPDCSIIGDYLELQRMLRSLLGNSIKFTASGSVELQFKVSPFHSKEHSLEQGQELVLEVQDTGYGMIEAEQATLFERFHTGIHKQLGRGLGLHLVQRIVQIHHGTITVQSEVGVGSAFTIRLPITINKS
jgi:two-component system, sensor histidine kinase and response regulator